MKVTPTCTSKGIAMNFATTDYKKVIRDRVEACKKNGLGPNFAELARATGTQKTYVSRVLNSAKAHFSRDQLYAICICLGFSDSEVDFCLTLHDCQTTQNKSRRQKLLKKVKTFRSEQLSTGSHLKQSQEKPSEADEAILKYYLDPEASLIHAMLGIEALRKNPQRIPEVLSSSHNRCREILLALERAGFITIAPSGEIILKRPNRHLARDHSLTAAHQTMLKLKCIEKCANLDPAQRFNFMVTFSGSDEIKAKIHARILEVIKETEQLVQTAPADSLYQFNIDLFPWIEDAR